MKQQLLRFIIALPFMVISLMGNAQVRTKTFKAGIPADLIATKLIDIPDILVKAPPEFEKFLSEKENLGEHKYEFGRYKQVDIDLLANALITEEDGYVTYLTTITAENALNIRLQFSEFLLPEHAVMRIYSKYELTENITSSINNKNNTWATRVYYDNKLTIALKVPVNEKGMASLKIGKISFGYKKNTLTDLANPGGSSVCNVDVRCSLGSGWGNEQNSVALVVADGGNGSVYFTGSLIMNTCGTDIPYILTAYHNIDPVVMAPPSPEHMVFIFQYWSNSCGITAGYTEDVQYTGCEIVASYKPTDFALLKLIPPLDKNDNLYFSGWDRTAAFPSAPLTVIHHPTGDVMKISRTTGAIQQTPYIPGEPSHWRGTFGFGSSGNGIVQRGSSGAPIYNADHRIVGQHRGNPFYNCNDGPGDPCPCSTLAETWGGKFSDSWLGGGTNDKQLKHWLDPNNSNTTFTTTTRVIDLQPAVFTPLVTGPASICLINSTINNGIDLPLGATATWVPRNNSVRVDNNNPNGSQVTITYLNNLNSSVVIDIYITLTGSCTPPAGNYTTTKTIALGGASCSTRTAYQMVNGNPVQVGNCIRLTELRSIYQKGKEGKYGLTEYYTTVWVTETYPNATTAWSYVSSSGSSGYPSYIVTGNSVQVFISNTLPYGWIRLRYTSTTSCGTYSQDYWFTPQPSTTSCPVFNPCMVAERTEEITNVPSEKISLSPNPTSNQFKVLLSTDVKDAVIREVRIKNKMGIEVYRQIFNNGRKEQTINLFNLPTDIYIVEVFDGKKWLTEKLSVQR